MLLLFSRQVVFDSVQLHGLEHTRIPCSTPSPGICPSLCTLMNLLWHPTISLSVALFCFQSFPASESFPVSHLFTSGGQRIGASTSASVLPMNIQGWFPLRLIGFIFFHWVSYSHQVAKGLELQLHWKGEESINCHW